jgi:hypothetical protein
MNSQYNLKIICIYGYLFFVACHSQRAELEKAAQKEATYMACQQVL